MSFKKNTSTRTLLVLAIFGLALSACTKKVPYDDAYKGFTDDGRSEVFSKDIIKEDKDQIFSTSVQEMSRKTANGQPFYYGENKRVRLKFTQNSLQVIEQDRDQRYQKPINDQLILEIPIEHVDYECAKDAYNECTSREQEKTNIPWNKKAKFRLRAAEAKLGAAERLPMLGEQFFGDGASCFNEISSQLVSYKVEAEAINIQVKRSYAQKLDCMSNLDTLSDTSVSAVFHYSMVRADKVLSSDFKPRSYEYWDEDHYGFFSTVRNVMDVDQTEKESGAIRLLNHWNPNRKSIDYYLSETFAKPENEFLKKRTYEAVDRINKGLEEAGVQFRLNLHDPAGKNPGDIRNSMIVLVEDPTESGLLGYGPQTEDPVTGEIISARVIMFLAGFEGQTRTIYNQIDRNLTRAYFAAEAEAKAQVTTEDAGQAQEKTQESAETVRMSKELQRQVQWGRYESGQLKSRARALLTPKASQVSANITTSQNSTGLSANDKNSRFYGKNERLLMNPEYMQGDIQSYAKYLREAKNCSMPAGTMNFKKMRPELAQEIVRKYRGEGGRLKPWKSLSDQERKDLVDTIVGESWISVTMHELTHNLGLTHNFQGSEDKENFYSTQELAAKGINYAIPYSTVMEYGDVLHELPYLGKYDIAALRYGYLNQVEVQTKGANGQVVKSELRNLDSAKCKPEDAPMGSAKCLLSELFDQNQTNKTDMYDDKAPGVRLRPFKFCMDSGVGPNPGCRRFDEGTTMSEMADYRIQHYKDSYEDWNFRNDRLSFSRYTEAENLQFRYAQMQELRVFMEVYAEIKHRKHIKDDDKSFVENEELKDIKSAALKAANFFLEVLQTPDLTCIFASPSNLKEMTKVIPIAFIGGAENNSTCEGLSLSDEEKSVAIGQFGKSFNSRKDPSSNNDYADQIDVRGYYLDKMAAARALFRRNMTGSLSTHNRDFDSAWDIEDIKQQIIQVTGGLVLNKGSFKTEVKYFDGREEVVDIAANYFSTHLIDQPIHPVIAERLGLRNTQQYFSEVLSNEIVKEATLEANTRQDGEDLKSAFSVHVQTDLSQPPAAVEKSLAVSMPGGRTLYVSTSNLLGLELVADLQLQRAVGAAFKDAPKELLYPEHAEEIKKQKEEAAKNQDPNAPAPKPERTAFIDLMNATTQHITPASAIQPAVVVELTEEDLAKIPTLTDDERAAILSYVKLYGTEQFQIRARQLLDGGVMEETDLLKILNYLPQI